MVAESLPDLCGADQLIHGYLPCPHEATVSATVPNIGYCQRSLAGLSYDMPMIIGNGGTKGEPMAITETEPATTMLGRCCDLGVFPSTPANGDSLWHDDLLALFAAMPAAQLHRLLANLVGQEAGHVTSLVAHHPDRFADPGAAYEVALVIEEWNEHWNARKAVAS